MAVELRRVDEAVDPLQQNFGVQKSLTLLQSSPGDSDDQTAPRIPEAQPSDPPLPTAAMLPSRETSNKNI
jgi:hypothetical protein